MRNRPEEKISSEVLAAFLDGDATLQESQEIMDTLSKDSSMRELLQISRSIDIELSRSHRQTGNLPLTAIAATCKENNYCCLECEKRILYKFGIGFNEEQVLRNSLESGWLKEKGTTIQDIGKLLESNGLAVNRKFNCSLQDLVKALDDNEGIIVAIDGGELLGDWEKEIVEDLTIGEIPDHTVVVLACDTDKGTVTIFDPNSCNAEDTYPLAQFTDAWNDSVKFMVTAGIKR